MAEQIFMKETQWSENKNNFIGEDEITVIITLAEYRELITNAAKTEQRINDAEEKARNAKKEAEAAKAKLDKVLSLTSDDDCDGEYDD